MSRLSVSGVDRNETCRAELLPSAGPTCTSSRRHAVARSSRNGAPSPATCSLVTLRSDSASPAPRCAVRSRSRTGSTEAEPPRRRPGLNDRTVGCREHRGPAATVPVPRRHAPARGRDPPLSKGRGADPVHQRRPAARRGVRRRDRLRRARSRHPVLRDRARSDPLVRANGAVANGDALGADPARRSARPRRRGRRGRAGHPARWPRRLGQVDDHGRGRSARRARLPRR